ncbi:hypothetical protein C0995_001319 [Termitomyces sp. Mi166|nr:hypothetical protein C0995_001319 [Termitomyces sp. Mi166\
MSGLNSCASLGVTPHAPSASGSGSGIPPTKAIGSLAKKQGDVTRQGAQKLKFVPTLPARRKKEEVKPLQEPAPAPRPPAPTNERGRGRGRGRGDARGRGRGRGAPPVVEMTASGPFAMGPALAGHTATRRAMPRSNFTPVLTSGSAPSLGSSLVRGAAPTLKREGKARNVKEEDDAEVYSDPDEGVEIIDMEDVRNMDWMAPESLRKENQQKKVKKEEGSRSVGVGLITNEGNTADVDHSNALDLSDSDEEEELEDIIEHFAATANAEQDTDLREERLYLFQFPSPFPTFVSPDADLSSVPVEDVSMADGTTGKKVAFASTVKSEAGASKASPAEAETVQPKVDGVIGRLEVYRSGTVKMRLANDIVLDVTAATQPSFLQQAVCLDRERKRLVVLGEVNKRFSVSPNVDTLLSAMELADKKPATPFDNEELIQMDMT